MYRIGSLPHTTESLPTMQSPVFSGDRTQMASRGKGALNAFLAGEPPRALNRLDNDQKRQVESILNAQSKEGLSTFFSFPSAYKEENGNH